MAWQRFGAEVRRKRSQAGLTQLNLGRQLSLSASMLSAIENGARDPKMEHAEKLDTALSTGGVFARMWCDINEALDVPDWWRDISVLERRAVDIREYQATMMPGLLQTQDYARSSMRAGRPWDAAETVERDVESRTARLEALRDDVALWFVVDEVVLSRVVGGRAVMVEQLDVIRRLIDEERIRLQVIPNYAPQHPGMSGPLRVLDFKDRPPVALAEHLMGEVIIDNPDEVRRCSQLYGALQAEARSPSDSAKMLEQLRREHSDA